MIKGDFFMRKQIGWMLGLSSFDHMIIFNQEKPYIQSSYVKIEDKRSGMIYLAEIMDCYTLPYLTNSNLPKGIGVDYFESHPFLGNVKSMSYFAQVKILNTALNQNITPESCVYEPTFEDLKYVLYQTEVQDGFTLGIINGTEYLQTSLPKELSNIAPLLEKDEEKKDYFPIHQNGMPYIYNFRQMAGSPHMGLFGSSGCGKSQALKVLEEECSRQHIPFLCFDPHNELFFQPFRKELKSIAPELEINFMDRQEIFEVGKDVGIHFEDLNYHSLVALFGFFEGGLTDSQKNVLQVLYTNGMSLSVLKYKVSTLLSAFMKKESERKGKKQEYTPDEALLFEQHAVQVGGMETVRAFSWRLNTLEYKNIFVSNIDGVVSCIQRQKGAIIRGNMEQLKVIGYFLMSELYHKRITYKEGTGDRIPPFLIFVDEAHNFAPEGKSTIPTKMLLRTLALESRKYGVFLCLATQRPANLDKTLLTQINNKFIFRIVDSNDMMALKTECNLTERELSYLPNLKSGNCYLALASQEKKFFIRFRATCTQDIKGDNPFDELKTESLNEIEERLLKYDCITAVQLPKILNELEDCDIMISTNEFMTHIDHLTELGYFSKESAPFGWRYIRSKKEV